MSGHARRRLSDTLTGLASATFPRERRSDARVVRDCARDAVDAAGLRALPRECVSLVREGLRVRIGLAATDVWHAPWRDALAVLALPLASAILLVWTFGFIPRYDHWPLGEGWAMLLGGSLLAVVGAALRHRWLTALGATATLVAAAAPYLGYGTDVAIAHTPSFFRGWSVDIGAASLLPTLLLVAGALSLPPRPRPPVREVMGRLALGLMPAVVAIGYLLPAPEPEPTRTLVFDTVRPTVGRTVEVVGPTVVVGPPYPMPWIFLSRTLVAALGIALAGGGRRDLAAQSKSPGARPRHRAGSRERGVSAGLGCDSLGAGADALLGVQRRLPPAARLAAAAPRARSHAQSRASREAAALDSQR